jgi:probable F420-dependent oxidoreductase
MGHPDAVLTQATMELDGIGVFAFLDSLGMAEAARFAQRVEALGYRALWFTEAPGGRDALAHAGWLLARTERLLVGTGVASVWARSANAMASAACTNAEGSQGRFALGIGINNPASVAMRGGTYSSPLPYMTAYLEQLKAFKYAAAGVAPPVPIVIGAQNPKMLELAGRAADGALTYFVTPEHTARARRLLGAGKRLIVEQAVLMERDAARARACARSYMAFYLSIPNYERFIAGMGFAAAEMAGGGSDRLVDAIVAWGDERAIRARLEEHRRAGADQVALLPLDPAGGRRPDLRALEAFAPG